MPSNFLPLHLKQTFPPIIWNFTKGEGDGIKTRLPFEIFSTLIQKAVGFINDNILKKLDRFCINGTIFTRWIHFCTDDSDI